MQDQIDIIELHREKVIRWLSVAATMIVLPFSFNNILQGRWLVGGASVAVVGILASNAWGKGRYRVNIAWLAPAIAVFLVMSLHKQGVIGAFWCYPALILFYFFLPHRQAKWVNLGLLCLVLPSVFSVLPDEYAWRVFATLAGVSITSGIFVHLIALHQEELRRMAVIDPLTQVHNRVNMDLILNCARARSHRHDIPTTILALDIDHFKAINDQFGHAIGDRVLREVASLLKGRIRKTDVIFRTGGEEFLILLDNTRPPDACRVADQLRALVAGAALLPARSVTVSLGLAELRPEESVDEWLKRADRHLYEAKNRGRNQVVACSA